MSRLVEGGILTIIFFLVVNVIFLNIFFISEHSKKSAAVTTTPYETTQSVCDDVCKQEITDKILLITSPAEKEIQTVESRKAQEFIIPLGSGSTSSNEYVPIPGAEAYIDTSLYQNIKKVIFETYTSIPTANGEVYVKLYNSTDKHDVWYSERSSQTEVVVMKEGEISLDKGKKLYRVMLKSTMAYEARLQNARIRIITE